MVEGLRGKVAAVTGASRGIGFALGKALAVAGCNVVVSARGLESLATAETTLKQHGTRVLAQPCDVRHEDEVSQLFETVRATFGHLDILVNNAGVAQPMSNIEDLPLEIWHENIDANLTGTFLCTKFALPLMQRGGAIVNTLSMTVREFFAGQAAYNASKAGALGFTNTLRKELRQRGIRVIALIPGATSTDIWERLWPDAPRDKMISPDTVALAVVNALTLPDEATVEELVIGPTAGEL